MIRLAPNFAMPDEAVTQTFGILAKRSAGKSNAGAVMAEEMSAADLPFVVIDPVGAWWGLRSNAKGTPAGGLSIPVLGGYHGDVPIEPTSGKLLADLIVGENLSAVLDVSHFETEAPKRRFLADFAERLYTVKGKPGNDTPLHLFLEEADDYIPQSPRGDAARTLGAFERIVKRGRSRGIGATMITQRSASLNKDVLTQIETLIVLRIVSPTDRKPIADWVKYHGQATEILSSLQELKPGEAWVWSMWLDTTERVQIRRRRTFDSGATPDVKKKRSVATLSDVDLDALHAQMKETIERAKSSDPRELQKRIRELEVELSQKPSNVKEIVKPEVREVPAMTDAQYAAFDRMFTESMKLEERVKDVIDEFWQKLSGPFIDVTETVAEIHDRERALEGRSVPEPVARALPPQPMSEATITAPATGLRAAVTPSERKVLDGLAWLKVAKLTPASRARLGWISGYKPGGGRFGNLLSEMRTSGLIDYPSEGMVDLTAHGTSFATAPLAVVTVEHMHGMVLSKLSPSERKIVEPLLRHYPKGLSREELGDLAGYDARGGRYGNLLSALRTLGVIEYPSQGVVRAAPVLFLEG